jgi:hypothetical protein
LSGIDRLAGTAFADTVFGDKPAAAEAMADLETAIGNVSAVVRPLEVDIRKVFEPTRALADATRKLSDEQQRLADAGLALRDMTAAEARELEALEQRMLQMERLAQRSAHKEKGMMPPIEDQKKPRARWMTCGRERRTISATPSSRASTRF